MSDAELEKRNNEMIEKNLFIDVCIAIASKDFQIDAPTLVQYASEVCDGFKKRFMQSEQ
jgi:hypothetical protein